MRYIRRQNGELTPEVYILCDNWISTCNPASTRMLQLFRDFDLSGSLYRWRGTRGSVTIPTLFDIYRSHPIPVPPPDTNSSAFT